MAIHERATDRLIGTCAFSQLDGENGSALYHITIGEKDAWGRGYGTEATRLMLDHAFGTLGLHRIALSVFEFNERAIRAYRRCGFVVEGRPRESIWRDGRWWDELAMSVLEIRLARRGRARRRGRGARRRGRRGGRLASGRRPTAAAGASSADHPAPSGDDGQRGPAADAARADFRELIEAKGHAVDNARAAVAGLEAAFAEGALDRTGSWTSTWRDLMLALEQDEGEKLGGKSAEAARFILRAIDRELDNA